MHCSLTSLRPLKMNGNIDPSQARPPVSQIWTVWDMCLDERRIFTCHCRPKDEASEVWR
ncbi:unnamed protein product [Tetraodon nigroviridis]|uniref:(spotted green pufferfish) hypothetical protein n=1 Tax=Tetraodon nigroviridis TaxID=99883 RepID=Q4RMI7_TETNG|nr:unnamed protein product [Tetraodon nigroviridis]